MLAGYQNTIDSKDWTLTTQSANKNKKPMVADIVCNSFFTRDKMRNGEYKFDKDSRDFINSILSDEKKTVVFPVFETCTEKNFNDFMLDGKFAEAVASVCLSDNKKFICKCFDRLKKSTDSVGSYDPALQYNLIKAWIEFFVNVKRDFKSSLQFIENLSEYYVGLLRDSGNKDAIDASKRIQCDLDFYKLTVYTHTGDVAGCLKTVSECDRAIEELPANLKNIDYRMKYAIRKITIFEDSFDYRKALQENSELIDKCSEVNALVSLFYGYSETHFIELAKAYSQRLQIKTAMIYQDRSLYESAIEDSENAIKHFETIYDKQRVYMSRAILESKMGHMEKAYENLALSAGLPADTEVKDLWTEISEKSIFYCNAFVQIMADGSENQKALADEMYKYINLSDKLKRIENEELNEYPEEVIFRNIGRYYANTGSMKAAEDCYSHAIKICNSDGGFTRNIIGFAIALEYCAYEKKAQSKNASNALSSVQKTYVKLEKKYPGEMERIFGEIDWDSGPDCYLVLSKKISF